MSRSSAFHRVELCAWALKRANGYGRDRRRLFCLEGNSIAYYADEGKTIRRGDIPLASISAVHVYIAGSVPVSERRFLLHFLGTKQTVLYLSDTDAVEEWRRFLLATRLLAPIRLETVVKHRGFRPLWIAGQKRRHPEEGSAGDTVRVFVPGVAPGYVDVRACAESGAPLSVHALKVAVYRELAADGDVSLLSAAAAAELQSYAVLPAPEALSAEALARRRAHARVGSVSASGLRAGVGEGGGAAGARDSPTDPDSGPRASTVAGPGLGPPSATCFRHVEESGLWLTQDDATLCDYALLAEPRSDALTSLDAPGDGGSDSEEAAGKSSADRGGADDGSEDPGEDACAGDGDVDGAGADSARALGDTEARESGWLRWRRGAPHVELWLLPLCEAPGVDMSVRVITFRTHKDMYLRDYTRYIMSVHAGALRWRISRRFREIIALHDALLRKAAERGLSRPPPPPARTLKNVVNEADFLRLRRDAVEKYLESVLAVDWCRGDSAVLSFLGAASTTRDEHGKRDRLTVHISRLSDLAQYGDLILFKCNTTISQLQRRVTRSEWDHVGVVVPGARGGTLSLLEATGEGVSLYPLEARLRSYSYEFAEYMCLRRLRAPRDYEVKFRLRKFATTSDGKPYRLTLGQVVRPRSDSADESAYFCSELVAAAYRCMGVLRDGHTDAAVYWPGDFRSGGLIDRALIDGASMSREIMIDTRRPEVGTADRVAPEVAGLSRAESHSVVSEANRVWQAALARGDSDGSGEEAGSGSDAEGDDESDVEHEAVVATDEARDRGTPPPGDDVPDAEADTRAGTAKMGMGQFKLF